MPAATFHFSSVGVRQMADAVQDLNFSQVIDEGNIASANIDCSIKKRL